MQMSPAPAQQNEIEEHAAQAAGGDPDALGFLYEKYADPVLRYMLSRTGSDQALAEDLAATTWERVATSIRRYEDQGTGFVSWLFTIARRAASEHFRTLFRRKERLDGAVMAPGADLVESAEEAYARHATATLVAAAVQRLPRNQRECLILRFYSNLSLADTAAVMGKTPNAIKQLQFRGLKALHAQLGELDPTQGEKTSPSIITISAAPSPTDSKVKSQ
jgi:RNA polymerase sigma-70 factor (ECF subfamily)